MTPGERALRPEPMLPQPYTVRRLVREIAHTFTLELVPADGSAVPPFAAGQCNMLYAFGVGEVPISISGDPTRPQPLVHTIRAVGAVTKAIGALQRGAVLGVRGPFGSAWPVAAAAGQDVLIVAGGLGLAPLRPVLYQILAQRQQYGKVMLVYGTRTPASLLYQRQLEQWRARFDLEVLVTVDHASTTWQGSVGVVTKLFHKLTLDAPETVAMLCGPEVMMRFTIMELLQRGLRDDQIFLSMERNMKCAIGFCGHCQFGPTFLCKDGPVLRYDRVQAWFGKREV